MKQVTKLMVLVVATVLSIQVSSAQTNTTVTAEQKTNNALAVRYLGEENGYQVFALLVTNGKNQVLHILDKKEGVLHTQTITASAKPQYFKIEKNDEQTLIFDLQSAGKHYTKWYSFKTVLLETQTSDADELAVL